MTRAKTTEATRANEAKLDLFEEHKTEYAARSEPAFVEVGPAVYLAIDGSGEPGGAQFEEKIGALYAMAFTIKMTRKFAGVGDYKVGKLEALWTMKGSGANECLLPRAEWQWTLLIRTPECVGAKDLQAAAQKIESKGAAPGVGEVRLLRLEEGRCVQILHVGPYEEIGRSYEKALKFAARNKCRQRGAPHDIYVSDPRRVDKSKLKTILRMPVE